MSNVRDLRRRFRLIAFRVRRLTRAQALSLLQFIRDGTPAQRRAALERLVPDNVFSRATALFALRRLIAKVRLARMLREARE